MAGWAFLVGKINGQRDKPLTSVSLRGGLVYLGLLLTCWPRLLPMHMAVSPRQAIVFITIFIVVKGCGGPWLPDT